VVESGREAEAVAKGRKRWNRNKEQRQSK